MRMKNCRLDQVSIAAAACTSVLLLAGCGNSRDGQTAGAERTAAAREALESVIGCQANAGTCLVEAVTLRDVAACGGTYRTCVAAVGDSNRSQLQQCAAQNRACLDEVVTPLDVTQCAVSLVECIAAPPADAGVDAGGTTLSCLSQLRTCVQNGGVEQVGNPSCARQARNCLSNQVVSQCNAKHQRCLDDELPPALCNRVAPACD